MAGEVAAGLRIDKWLWFARFYKSRSLAATIIEAGEVLLNDHPVNKSSREVRAGDLLRFPLGRQWRSVRVLALSDRRGPAPEAQSLYEDLGFSPREW